MVDFLRRNYGISKLGVHGESLGGMVACHLAKAKELNYLFSNRTFSNLSEVSKWGFSKPISILFNLLTNWSYDSSQAFIDSTGYKILGYDPNDEVIPYMASLKVGVV